MMRNQNTVYPGFTLIELLVVIAIIGILASVVVASLVDARNNAKHAVVQQELRLIAQSLVIAGGGAEPIIQITGHRCSMCACRGRHGGGSDLRTVDQSSSSDSQECIRRWESALEAIANQSILIDNVEELKRDPWGSPYLLDENEAEFSHSLCRADSLSSAGADGVMSTADDYTILLPFRTATCNN